MQKGMSELNCPICEKLTLSLPVFKMNEYQVVKCEACQTIYNLNFGSDETGSSVFEQDYFENVQEPAFIHVKHESHFNESLVIYNKFLSMAQHRIGKKGKVLDVGAAFGDFVKEASDNGWDALGVEISEFASSVARDERHLNVLTGTIENVDCRQKFDLITYWDVIEHVENCTTNLNEIKKRLSEDGILLIATDNYQSFLGGLCKMIFSISFGTISYPVKRFYIKQNTIYPEMDKFIDYLENSGLRIVYFEKIDYPLRKIKLNFFESFILKVIYFVGKILKSNTQMLILCERI
jgi:SAM-dependent methyltransferase